MDDLYDPAEVYADDDNGDRNGNFPHLDVGQSESKRLGIQGEESDLHDEERFLRTEGCETKRSALQRLSPSLDPVKSDRSSESHASNGSLSRLVIFNIPLCVTDASRVQTAVQEALKDDGVVEFVEGVYMRSAVVTIKPVSAVETVAQRLTHIDDLPVIARKMTSKDYNVFLKKKVKAELRAKTGDVGKEVITIEDDADRSASPFKITISNVSHSISAKNLADTLKARVGGIMDVVLHSPPPPNRQNRQHSGKGYVAFYNKRDAVKFFRFHRMRVAGRDLIIHRTSVAMKKSAAAKRQAPPSSSRKEYHLKISNLSVEVSSQELQEIFAGEVNGRVRVTLGRRADAPHSGSGELAFETAQLAKMAHELMDGCDLGGSKIVLQMDFDENETNEDVTTNSNNRDEDKESSSMPSDDFKNDGAERQERETELDQAQRQRDRDRREEREKEGQHSRESLHRSRASSEARLSEWRDRSQGRERDRSREKSREKDHDRSRHGSRDKTHGGSQDGIRGGSRDGIRDESQDKTRGGSRDRTRCVSRDRTRDVSRDRTRDVSRDRTRDVSRDRTLGGSRDRTRGGSLGRNKGESRVRPMDQSMDTSRERGRTAQASDMDYRRYRGVHIYTERELFARRSSGPELQLQFSNIAYNLHEEKLVDFVLSKCSGLVMLHYGRNKLGAFQGMALLEFKSRADAVSALNLRNASLEGRKIVVKIDVSINSFYSDFRSPKKKDGRPIGLYHNMDARMLPGADQINHGLPVMGEMPRSALGPIMDVPKLHGPIMGGLEPHRPIMGRSLLGPNDPHMGGSLRRDSGLQAPLLGDGPSSMEMARSGERGLLAMPASRGSFGGPAVTRDDISDGQLSGSFPAGGGRSMASRQHTANQILQQAQHTSPDGAGLSSETFGLSATFLESLGITLPLVKEVLVMNVDVAATEDDLKELFSIAGTVASVQYNPQYGQAIIEMAHPVEAVQSISMLHQQEYFDRFIAVRLLRPNDPENLVARPVAPAKPRGLKTIGRGLGVGGMPVSALPVGSSQPQPSDPGLSAKMANSRMQEQELNRMHMNAGANVNRKSTHASRWGGKVDERDDRPATNRFGGESRPDIPLNFPPQLNRGASNDLHGQHMSGVDMRNADLNDRQFRDQHSRGVLPTPQISSYNREENRSFSARGSALPNRGRGNRLGNSAKLSGNSSSMWYHSRTRERRGSREMATDQPNLGSRGNSSSSRGRGILRGNSGQGYGSRNLVYSNLNANNNPSENASNGRIVILSNLPPQAHESSINEICSPFGLVKNIALNSHRRACRVIFDSYQQASMAADILNNQDFFGSTISAKLA